MSKEKAGRDLVRYNMVYMRELRSLAKDPSFTREEEREYIRRYKEEGDIDARNKVVTKSLRSVMRHITWVKMNNKRIEVNDLISELNISLIEAVDKYDLDSSARFNTFAFYVIKFTLMSYLRSGWQIVRTPKSLWDKWKLLNEDLSVNDVFVSLDNLSGDFLYGGLMKDVQYGDDPLDNILFKFDSMKAVTSYFEKNATQLESDLMIIKIYNNSKYLRTYEQISKKLGIPKGRLERCWRQVKSNHKNFFKSLKKRIDDEKG